MGRDTTTTVAIYCSPMIKYCMVNIYAKFSLKVAYTLLPLLYNQVDVPQGNILYFCFARQQGNYNRYRVCVIENSLPKAKIPLVAMHCCSPLCSSRIGLTNIQNTSRSHTLNLELSLLFNTKADQLVLSLVIICPNSGYQYT